MSDDDAQRGHFERRSRFELMPLIDSSKPPGAEQIVGWAARCLRCPAPHHKGESVETAEVWMAAHEREGCAS